jgi:GT2 family glycosyltransferase
MTSSPEVSIIIVSWNTREDLLACLASIKREVRGVDHEVLVIDNGSRDGSPEAVRREAPWTTVIENGGNLGFARAANQGLRRMRGRYALLLNPDARLRAGALEILVAFMESHRNAGVAGGQLLNGDGSRQNSIANFPSLATELLNKSLLRRFSPETFPGKERVHPGPLEVDSVIGVCMLVRGEAIGRVGLLDESYFLFLEETDWCWRIRKAGWKTYHVPAAEIDHLQGRSAGTVKKRARVEYYRSRYLFFRKHHGPARWAILHGGLCAKLGFEFLFMLAGCTLSLFTIGSWRKRLALYAYLLRWHLRFCPRGMGLEAVGRTPAAGPCERTGEDG